MRACGKLMFNQMALHTVRERASGEGDWDRDGELDATQTHTHRRTQAPVLSLSLSCILESTHKELCPSDGCACVCLDCEQFCD